MTQAIRPSIDEAMQFCVMLQAGLPASQAILYFTEETDPAALNAMLSQWTRSRAVAEAQKRLMGKSWQEMGLDEKIRYALDQHYAQLAYLLYSHHYGEVGAAELAKLNTARVSLEAKLAGTAGKQDALSVFFDDLKSGRVKLAKPAPMVQ